VPGEVLGRGDPDVLGALLAEGLADAMAAGESVTTGASVGAASTWKSDWPPDSNLKCTEFRFFKEVVALSRILCGSSSVADVQPETRATMARMPAAVMPRDFRRDT
jgi:hypothetical protein